MKSVVIYDSMFGNTEIIAKAITEICGAKLIQVSSAKPSDLEEIDLLIVGSPTQGGRPMENMQQFMHTLIDLGEVRAAAFDTRLKTKLVSIFGYAADKIAKELQKNNAKLMMPPEGFFVDHKEGPLMDGELERAKAWAQKIIEQS